MQNITKEQYHEFIELMEKAEEILRLTELDDESYLLNHVRNYVRMRYSKVSSKNSAIAKTNSD